MSRLAEVIREAVEDEQKVLHELALPETKFTVNQVHTYALTHITNYMYVHTLQESVMPLFKHVHAYMAMNCHHSLWFTDWLWVIIEVTNRCVQRLHSQRRGSLVPVNWMWI